VSVPLADSDDADGFHQIAQPPSTHTF
jgi:hypothetical protein